MSQRYAPSVRVEIRDAEWRIKCIDHTSDGGELLTCEDQFELVRGRKAAFLTKNEPNIRVLAPEDTVLVDDTSSAYRASRLYLATPIRQASSADEKIYLGQYAACKTHTDTTQATGPVERIILYEAPFFKPNWEEGYATAGAFFENQAN